MNKVLRLVRFKLNNDNKGIEKFGAILHGKENEVILDFNQFSSLKFPELKEKTTTMLNLIKSGENTIQILKDIINSPSFLSKLDSIDARHVTLLSPIDPVRNILCIGKNYSDHVTEIQKANEKNSGSGSVIPVDIPKYPMFFSKATTAVIGPNAVLENHSSITKHLDYEVELAVIIGKNTKNVSASDAMSRIFGYTIANDVTARDVQRRHGQWFKGKSLDTSCPLGPCIIPSCDLDPRDLSIKLYLNDVLKQNSRTSKMIFDIPSIIESLSAGMTLLPGDIILTGTPDGVGYASNPPRTLLPGDSVRLEIEGIGSLINTVAN
jgi:2-keto-4-pentenoate hydratase/2-oxohepta-3-ene-1,7-dioic acid hydratase in catechol pathway